MKYLSIVFVLFLSLTAQAEDNYFFKLSAYSKDANYVSLNIDLKIEKTYDYTPAQSEQKISKLMSKSLKRIVAQYSSKSIKNDKFKIDLKEELSRNLNYYGYSLKKIELDSISFSTAQ